MLFVWCSCPSHILILISLNSNLTIIAGLYGGVQPRVQAHPAGHGGGSLQSWRYLDTGKVTN